MRKKLNRFLLGFLNMIVVLCLAAGVGWLAARTVPGWRVEPLMAGALLPLYVAGSRWIERRSAIELRLSGLAAGIGEGTALGVALFSAVMGALWLCGAYSPTGWVAGRPLATALLLTLCGATLEETIFRGFLFRLIAGLGGDWTALAVTSAFFGLAHINNRGATVASSAAIAIEAGILLGAAYAASGSLWLPIGIHAGWNFAEGPIFGMAVSGNAQKASLIAGDLRGPAWLTGGPFGPEASLVAVVVCLALAAVYLRGMISARRASDRARAG